MRKARNHLRAREQFTPHAHDRKEPHKNDRSSVENHISPRIMQGREVALTHALKGHAYDVDDNNRGARQRTPQDIGGRSAMICNLRRSDPAQERKRQVRDRRTAGEDDQISGTIGKTHHVAVALRIQGERHQRRIKIQKIFGEERKQQTAPQHRHGHGQQSYGPASALGRTPCEQQQVEAKAGDRHPIQSTDRGDDDDKKNCRHDKVEGADRVGLIGQHQSDSRDAGKQHYGADIEGDAQPIVAVVDILNDKAGDAVDAADDVKAGKQFIARHSAADDTDNPLAGFRALIICSGQRAALGQDKAIQDR